MRVHAKVRFVSVALLALSACAGQEVEDAGRKPPPRPSAGAGGDLYYPSGYAGSGQLGKGGMPSALGGNAGHAGTAGSAAGASGSGGSAPASTGGNGAAAGGSSGNGTLAASAGNGSASGAIGGTANGSCPSPAYAKLPNGACTERVTEYDIGVVPTINASPTSIVLGADQRIWVDDDTGNQIIQLDKDGRAGIRVKCDEGSWPRTLAGGKDDSAVIWYTDSKAQTLIKVSKGLQTQATPLPFKASGIALGNNGDVFLAEFGKSIYRVQPNQPIAAHWPASPAENTIVVSPDNNVWNAGGLTLTRLNPSSGTTDFPVDPLSADNLCLGPDMMIWFSDTQSSRLNRMDLNGRLGAPINLPTNSGPTRIIAGPDGALWFIEEGVDMIGRVTTGGTVTHYPLPTSGVGLSSLTVGADGYIWFTEGSAHKVGRLIPDPKQ